MLQISRRAWAENENAEIAIKEAMEDEPKLKVTLPVHADDDMLEKALALLNTK